MERKHARKTVPLKRKIELIQEVEDNPMKLRKTIANEFRIPSCTLTTIMRDKEKYKKQYLGGECLQKKGERSATSGNRGLTFTLVHSSKVQ